VQLLESATYQSYQPITDPMGESSQLAGASMPPFYQHVVVRGLPFDRGFSHGQQAKSKIEANIAHYKKPGKLPPW
jgi:hypothetical protein